MKKRHPPYAVTCPGGGRQIVHQTRSSPLITPVLRQALGQGVELRQLLLRHLPDHRLGQFHLYPLHKPHLPIARRSLEAELPFSPEFIP
uniref:Uncharacterized protein n=1 Tax=Ectopseudomonas mendocina (strain ymp) TaxID=399739 RepID=A4XSJ8_ECTM1